MKNHALLTLPSHEATPQADRNPFGHTGGWGYTKCSSRATATCPNDKNFIDKIYYLDQNRSESFLLKQSSYKLAIKQTV